MNLKPIIDTAVNVAAAVSAPVIALLIDTHVWSGQVGTDVGVIVAAAVAAYHGGTFTQRRAEANRPKVVATVVRPERQVPAVPGSTFSGSESAVVAPGDQTQTGAGT